MIGDEDCVNMLRNHGITIIYVLNGHLGLSIRPQLGASYTLSNLCELFSHLGSQYMGQGHHFRCLISCIAKQVTLVTGSNLLKPFVKFP